MLFHCSNPRIIPAKLFMFHVISFATFYYCTLPNLYILTGPQRCHLSYDGRIRDSLIRDSSYSELKKSSLSRYYGDKLPSGVDA